jgi:hypothetical protein
VSGRIYWIEQLARGVRFAEVLIVFSESHENNDLKKNVLSNGAGYLDWNI